MSFQYCKEAIEEWQKNKDDDFVGNLDEDIFVGVGEEIYQLLIKYNTEEQLRKVYNIQCNDCKYCQNNICKIYDYKENCLKQQISYSWLYHIMKVII